MNRGRNKNVNESTFDLTSSYDSKYTRMLLAQDPRPWDAHSPWACISSGGPRAHRREAALVPWQQHPLHLIGRADKTGGAIEQKRVLNLVGTPKVSSTIGIKTTREGTGLRSCLHTLKELSPNDYELYLEGHWRSVSELVATIHGDLIPVYAIDGMKEIYPFHNLKETDRFEQVS